MVPLVVLGWYETQRWRRFQTDQADHQQVMAVRSVADLLALVIEANEREIASVSDQVRALGTLDPARVQPILDAARASRPTLAVYVTDATLTAVVASPATLDGRTAVGRYYGDRAYVRDAVTGHQITLSQLELGRLTRQPNLHVGIAMRRPDDSLLGFTGAALDLQMIDQVALRSAALTPGLRLIVVDPVGHAVIHPDPAKQAAMADLSGLAMLAPVEGAEPAIRETTDDAGTAVRAAVLTMRGKVAWTVAVYQPVIPLEAEASATAHTLAAVVIGILLCAFAMAAMFAAWLAAPIVRLANFVAGRGDPRAVVVPRRGEPREIADLLDATGAMMTRLSAQTADLEAQVAQRSNELTRAQDRLARAERLTSLGTLAAGMAHEINNPLTYIIGNLEETRAALPGVARDPLDPRVGAIQAGLDEALEGADRVRQLVRDLSFYSQRDGRGVEPVRVATVVDSAIKLASVQVKHRARVSVAFGRDVPPVDANQGRLVQVVLNLLVNAAQAIPEDRGGDSEIVVSTFTGADGRVGISVRDPGSGIDPSHLPRLFDPFFTTKPVGEGTGLGLFICHTLVSSLGGEIAVDTALGHGSTFTIWLPASAAPAPATAVVEDAGPHALPRATILVIDDEPAIGKVVGRHLQHVHDVTYEPSAQAALDRIAGGARYDVILCDLMMPGMDGMRFHEALAATMPAMLERLAFITGGASTPRTAAFLANVGRPTLLKPFTRAELVSCIESLIDPE